MDGKGNAMSAISPTDLLSDQSLSRCPDHISSPFGLFYTHASRVQKFLDSAREELRAYFGDYDYTIMQVSGAPRSGKYEIHAHFDLRGERHFFVDGRGSTPAEALLSVNQMRQFLRKLAILA